MASIFKDLNCLPISSIQIVLFRDRYTFMQSHFFVDIIIFHALFSVINLLQGGASPLRKKKKTLMDIDKYLLIYTGRLKIICTTINS